MHFHAAINVNYSTLVSTIDFLLTGIVFIHVRLFHYPKSLASVAYRFCNASCI